MSAASKLSLFSNTLFLYMLRSAFFNISKISSQIVFLEEISMDMLRGKTLVLCCLHNSLILFSISISVLVEVFGSRTINSSPPYLVTISSFLKEPIAPTGKGRVDSGCVAQFSVAAFCDHRQDVLQHGRTGSNMAVLGHPYVVQKVLTEGLPDPTPAAARYPSGTGWR